MFESCLVIGLTLCLAVFAVPGAASAQGDAKHPVVVLETSKGNITIELDAEKAPITVKNFLEYVDKGHYEGVLFHRVIPGFMIQGGGYNETGREKPTSKPIKNEGGNGLRNARGTIAMARTSVPDSASAQFFINLKNNDFLDRDRSQDGVGYAVFGHVTEGMDVVDAIAKVPTGQGPMGGDYPREPVVIKSAKRK